MKNPYGLQDGKLVSVDTVESGLACGCVCPACNEPLEAHKGKLKIHYFKHYNGSDCGYGLETATHLLAKSIIENEKILLLPSLQAPPDWKQLPYLEAQYLNERPFPHHIMFKELVPPWYKLKVDEVLVEKRVGSIIPDVIVVAKGKQLFVEIKVTHGIDDKKLKYIKENRISVVEYDFSKMRNTIDVKHIKYVLTESYKGATKGKGLGRWINHRGLQKAITEVTQNMRIHYPEKVPEQT